jgi:hypothetical protein
VTGARQRGLVALLALGILAGNVAWVSARLGFLHKPHQVAEQDHLRYIEMARGPAGDPQLALQSPYCWRVLVPALARGLAHWGVKLNLAFWVLTNLALLGFLLTLERYLALLGFDWRERMLGLTLVGLVQGCVRWFEYQYWMTDPAGLLLVVLALLLARRDRVPALCGLSVVAALVRETYVIVFPYVFFQRLSERGWRDALRTTVFTALPFVAVLAILHLRIAALTGPSLIAAVADNLDFRLRHLLDNQLYLMTFGTWGVLVPLALLFPARVWALARTHLGPLALLVTVYVTTFLISNNNERPLAYAVPVVLPAALDGLRCFVALSGVRFSYVAAAVLALQIFVYQQTLFTGLGISIYQPTNLLVIAALVVAYIAARVRVFARTSTADSRS